MARMDIDAVRDTLSRTPDAREACRVAVHTLKAVPGLMPSAYLERGGRLRCQAVHGYWQVRDGIPPGTGVIGEVFRSGEECITTGSGPLTAHYLPAADAVIAEVAFPLRMAGRTFGVLNVEATRVLTPEDVAAVRAGAQARQDRIVARGGPPAEAAAQRLVRHAAAIAGLHEETEVERATLAAAIDVLHLDSAVLLRVSGPNRVRPGPALGPLADVLTSATSEVLAAVAGYVVDGTSAYTVANAAGDATAGVRALRDAGAAALAAVQIDPERILVLADRNDHPPHTDDIELLELLAVQAAVCLRTAASVSALRVQAASDPLTGLGHHRTFHQALERLRPVAGAAVLVADIDGFKAYNDANGHPAGDRLLRQAASVLAAALRRDDMLYRIGGDEFAALLLVAGPHEALEVGRRLRDAIIGADLGVSVSVGIAVFEPGESETSVLARADRALYAVKADGRDGVRLAGPESHAAPNHSG